jgi:hypothetical protein
VSERHLPFRPVTQVSWGNPDPIMQHFGGENGPIDGARLADKFMAAQLIDAVPDKVRALFETARGAFCYGYYFYPLYALATEQLYRVVEAGLRHRLGCASEVKPPNFAQLIDKASRIGLIDEKLRGQLDGVRHLRNAASHATEQNIFPPGVAIRTLTGVADLLNALFA